MTCIVQEMKPEVYDKAWDAIYEGKLIDRWMEKTDVSLAASVFDPPFTGLEMEIEEQVFIQSSELGLYAAWSEYQQWTDCFEDQDEPCEDCIVFNKFLDKANETPICYLDEVISPFDLPVPSGLECLALFRLFRITVDDEITTAPTTEFVSKKQKVLENICFER